MATIHIIPRALSREHAEQRALFLVKESVTQGVLSDLGAKALLQLKRSQNAAIANEAAMLAGRLEAC